jgi:putative transposase
MLAATEKYKGYRYPIDIIQHAVYLYHRFTVSLRDVDEMLLYWGIVVSYEAIREWGIKLDQRYANCIKQRAPRRGDKWHLDEMYIVINKRKHWLWRAVDQDGYELDIVLQSRRG